MPAILRKIKIKEASRAFPKNHKRAVTSLAVMAKLPCTHPAGVHDSGVPFVLAGRVQRALPTNGCRAVYIGCIPWYTALWYIWQPAYCPGMAHPATARRLPGNLSRRQPGCHSRREPGASAVGSPRGLSGVRFRDILDGFRVPSGVQHIYGFCYSRRWEGHPRESVRIPCYF